MPKSRRRPGPREAAERSASRREPRRTCVGCRSVRPQHQLVRLVADGRGGVAVSPRRVSGRGAYVCAAPACLEAALRRKVLPRALRAELPTLDATTLRQQVSIEANRREVGRDIDAGALSSRPQ